MKQPVIYLMAIILVGALNACGPTAEQLAATFVAETAAALGLSDRTVRRDWALARAWLSRELKDDKGGTRSE